MLKWKIYYDDETTFSSEDGSPKEAPSFGIQSIVQPDPETGRVILTKFDWYYYHDAENEWWAGDLQGVLDLLLHNEPISALKMGRNCTNIKYKKILSKVINDEGFPLKTNIHCNENSSIKL